MVPARDTDDELDSLCREVLETRRLDAFDNVDVERFLASPRIGADRARWIGRYLMLNGRSLASYRDGQKLLRLAGPGE